MVPISLQCPQEIVPFSLPTSVLLGTASSSKFLSQLPSRNVAVLRGSLPLKKCLEQLDQLFPAGPPLQGTELVVPSTPEASLERLVPLVHFMAVWKLLPNASQWVLHRVERGYKIQFGSRPPLFNGVFPTQVGPVQALVMEQVDTLMRKETTEVRVLLPLLHHSEEGWGLRPILDLRLLNRSVMRLKFKMLTIKQVMSQIRSEDWFVTIDLKDAYFHISILPQHRKFLRVALRGKSYQYRVLTFGLALSHRTFTKCVDATLAPLRLQSIRILN